MICDRITRRGLFGFSEETGARLRTRNVTNAGSNPVSHECQGRFRATSVISRSVLTVVALIAILLAGEDVVAQQLKTDSSVDYGMLAMQASSEWPRQPAKACAMLEQAIQIAERAPRFGDWEVVEMRNTLASYYRLRGNLAQARSILQLNLRVTKTKIQGFDYDSPWPLLSVLAGLLDVYTLEGDYKSLQRLSDEFIPLVDASFTKHGPLIDRKIVLEPRSALLSIRRTLIRAAFEQGDLGGAEKHIDRHKHWAGLSGNAQYEELINLDVLTLISHRRNNGRDVTLKWAARAWQAALESSDIKPIDNLRRGIGWTLQAWADDYWSLGLYKKWADHYKQLLEFRKTYFDKTHPSIVNALIEVGSGNVQLGRYEDAIRVLEPLVTPSGQPTAKYVDPLSALRLRFSESDLNARAKELDKELNLKSPDNPTPSELFRIYSHPKAVAHLVAMAGGDDRILSAVFWLGRAYQQTGKQSEAEAQNTRFQKVLESDLVNFSLRD